MARNFRIDHGGVAEMLKSEPGIYSLIDSMTQEAGIQAEQAFPPGFTVLNGVLITDRPQGNVTVANRSAEAMEGKYGYLAQAASGAGFEPLRSRG